MPAQLEEALGPPPFDIDWSLAQLLPRTPWPVWAVPGSRHICLAAQEGPGGTLSVSCKKTKDAIAEGTFTASLTDASMPTAGERRTVVGLVPDQIRAVRLQTPGHPTVQAPVSQNTFTHHDNQSRAPETLVFLR